MTTKIPKDRATNFNEWAQYINQRTKELAGYKTPADWSANTYTPKAKTK